MDFTLLVIGVFGLTALAQGEDNPGTPEWGYECWNGPKLWPEMFPQFCAGREQSPINVETSNAVFNANLQPFRVIENGDMFNMYHADNTVEIEFTGEHLIEGGGLDGSYQAGSFHFHWGARNTYGSEHSLNGKFAPIELHIKSTEVVAEGTEDPAGVAAFAVLFKLSKHDNPVLEPIIRALPTIADPDWNVHVKLPAISIDMLLPRHSHKFYRYTGSLTTPECNEGLTWTVFHMPQCISKRQLRAFRKVLKRIVNPKNGRGKKVPLVNNFRPVQPLNGRIVYRSFFK